MCLSQKFGIPESQNYDGHVLAMNLFAGGFLHGYINKLPIKTSLEKGTEMSSKIIQKIGARLD